MYTVIILSLIIIFCLQNVDSAVNLDGKRSGIFRGMSMQNQTNLSIIKTSSSRFPVFKQRYQSSLFDFFRRRTNYPELRSCLWHFSGNVRHPMNGREIAGIEGLELITAVEPVGNSGLNDSQPGGKVDSLFSRYQKRRVFSYLSNKVYLYVQPHDHTKLLEKIKIREMSPKRNVKNKRKCLTWNSLVEYDILTVNNSVTKKLFQSVIQFPSSRKVFSKNLTFDNSFETNDDHKGTSWSLNTVVATHRVNNNPKNSIDAKELKYQQHLLEESKLFGSKPLSLGNKISQGIAKVVDKAKSLVSFSATGESNSLHDFSSSTEQYKIHSIPNKASGGGSWIMTLLRGKDRSYTITMDYRRFGEAPSWFSPGKPAIVDLQGRRYASLYDLPVDVQKLFREHAPDLIDNIEKICNAVDPAKELTSVYVNGKDENDNYLPWYTQLGRYFKRNSKQ